MTPSPLDPAFRIRGFREEDETFLWDSWVKSFRTSPYAGVVRNIDFHTVTVEVIDELRKREGAVIEVVCAAHNPDQILAWCCSERTPSGDTVLHYVYVKDPFRRRGLATHLLERARAAHSPQARHYHTFRTRDFDRHLNPRGEWRWAPEIARRK